MVSSSAVAGELTTTPQPVVEPVFFLDPSLLFWGDGKGGMVAYADTGGAWVTAGAPLFSASEDTAVLRQFVEAGQRAGRRVRFFGVEPHVLGGSNLDGIEIGLRPVWDPQAWWHTLRSQPKLREQLRRARAAGIHVDEVPSACFAPTGHLRAQAETLLTTWLAGRGMPPLSFVARPDPFWQWQRRRYFVARRGTNMVGLLVANPLPNDRGATAWDVPIWLRHPGAPNGTTDALVDRAFRAFAAAGARYATLGLAPLADSSNPWLHRIGRACAPLYNFSGLHRFKARLHPRHWERVVLAYPVGDSALAAIYDALSAFADGQPWRFLARTAVRRPGALLQSAANVLASS